MARRLGITSVTISLWETGKKRPSPMAQRALHSAFPAFAEPAEDSHE